MGKVVKGVNEVGHIRGKEDKGVVKWGEWGKRVN